jgi:hypothetical protein
MALPQSFVEFSRRTESVNGSCGLELIKKVDSFGNFLETELSVVFFDAGEIIRETESLAGNFVPDGYYGSDLNMEMPGAIPDIVSFEKIVCFGMAGDGAPFCFDFRNDKNNPCVIWWDDNYWRKISNSFDEFISLFQRGGKFH